MIDLFKKHYYAHIVLDDKVIGHVHSSINFWESSHKSYTKIEEWLHSFGYESKALL